MKKLRILYLSILTVIIIVGLYFVSVVLLNYQARMDFERGQEAKAINKLNLVLKINPNFAPAYFNLGNSYMSLGKYTQAIVNFKTFVSLNQGSKKAYFNLAEAYSYDGQYRNALAILEKHRKQGGEFEAFTTLYEGIIQTYSSKLMAEGLGYFENGDFNSAIKKIEESLSINGDFELAYHNLGRIYFLKGDLEKSANYLKKSVELDPNDFGSYKMLGEIAYQVHEYAQAINYFSHVLVLNPSDSKVYNDLCFAYYMLGNYDDAIIAIRKAVELEPANMNFRYTFASILRDAGNYDQSLKQFLIVAGDKPDIIGLHRDMAGIYFLRGEEQEGRTHLDEEISQRENFLLKNPQELNSLLVLAEAYKDKAEYAKALEIYRDIQKNESDSENLISEKVGVLEKILLVKKDNLRDKRRESNTNSDTIILKNGRKIQGRIVYQDSSKLVLEITFNETKGTVTLNLDQIESVEEG